MSGPGGPKILVLAQADFDLLPKGVRGTPTWRAEKTGELWPEPDDPDEWRDECDDPSREDEDEGDE